MRSLPAPVIASAFVLSFSFISCTSNEIGNMKDVNPQAIFFDYVVMAEEGAEDVTVRLQYRMGGPNGTTLVLDEPCKVELDGQELKGDSAKFLGAYYELQKSVNSFSGKHIIRFTDVNKKEYSEEFEFRPFYLEPDLPQTITRDRAVFNFKGLEQTDYLTVLLTDTSFESDDINELDTIQNGQLVLSPEKLSTLKNGPISLHLIRETENAVKNGTKEGGKLRTTYGLKRQFELKD